MAHLVSSGDGLVVTVDRESGRERCVVFTIRFYLVFVCEGLSVSLIPPLPSSKTVSAAFLSSR